MACIGSVSAPLFGCCGGLPVQWVAVTVWREVTAASIADGFQYVQEVINECINTEYPDNVPGDIAVRRRFWDTQSSAYIDEFDVVCSNHSTSPDLHGKVAYSRFSTIFQIGATKQRRVFPDERGICVDHWEGTHGFLTGAELFYGCQNVVAPGGRLIDFGLSSDVVLSIEMLPPSVGPEFVNAYQGGVTAVGQTRLATVSLDSSIPAPCNPAP